MKNEKKIWLIFTGLALVAVSLGVRYHLKKGKGLTFRRVQVTRGDLRVTILTTGIIQPENRVEIKPPIPGRIEKIVVLEGRHVKAGDVLAWMSSTDRAALLDAARAKGPEELAHWEELYKATPLVAPLDGIIIARNVEAGQTVTAQDTVYVLSDHLIVKANVDETDIGQIKRNQKADFNLDSFPKVPLAGSVFKIALEAKTVSNVTNYQVEVLPNNVPPFMKSGMTANVTFIVATKKDTLILPAEAVHEEGSQHFVWIPDPSRKDRHASQEIQTGLNDGKRVEVLSGLREGDAVLAATLPSSATTGSAKVNPFAPFSGARRAH